MGGYGALRVGLAYPERFCSIHSSAGSLERGIEFKLNPAERTGIIAKRPESFVREMRRIFGERPAGTSHDVLKLAIDAKARGTMPQLWIDCGANDQLLAGTRAFHRELEVAGIGHAYHELPGTHGWDYYDAHLEKALAFHTLALGLAPDPRQKS